MADFGAVMVVPSFSGRKTGSSIIQRNAIHDDIPLVWLVLKFKYIQHSSHDDVQDAGNENQKHFPVSKYLPRILGTRLMIMVTVAGGPY